MSAMGICLIIFIATFTVLELATVYLVKGSGMS